MIRNTISQTLRVDFFEDVKLTFEENVVMAILQRIIEHKSGRSERSSKKRCIK